MPAHSPRNHRYAGEDQRSRNPCARIPLLSEDQWRKREGDERLKIDIGGDGAWLDARQRPGVQVVGADGREENYINHSEPYSRSRVTERRTRQFISPQGHSCDASEDEKPGDHSQSPVAIEQVL